VQREVRERLRLPLSVGVAANKLVSQAATTVVKPEPLLEVPGGNEASFLAPHPLDVLPDLHPRMRRRLDDYQLDLIGEVAAITESALCAVFGGAGRALRAQARGIDPRPVLSPERQAEFHVVHALATDTNDLGVLYPLLRLLGERLGRRLRRRGLVAQRLHVALSYADHTDATRAVPLKAATLDVELWEAARRAFALANAKRLAVRSVSLTLDRIVEAETQMELWDVITSHPERSEGAHAGSCPLRFAQGDSGRDDSGQDNSPGFTPGGPHRPRALQHALDRISTRYGARALTTGAVRTLTK